METMIGLVTMTALVWVLVNSLVRESDAERRRVAIESAADGDEPVQEAA